MDSEDDLLRTVAFQNAQSIQRARQRADDDLVRAKEALERNTDELAHSLAVMRATLEATTDSILVTDDAGRLLAYNERFARLWQLPRGLMESVDHWQLRDTISLKCKEPAAYRARIDAIYAEAPPESYDVIELADGRTYERFSRTQYVDGRNAGRVWSLRNITESRRAEEALQERVRLNSLRADTSSVLASTQDLTAILQRCVELLVSRLDVAFARIWTLNEPENMLELQASAGLYTHRDGPHSRVPVGQDEIGLIAEERKAHLSNDIANDDRLSDPEWAKREGMVAFAGYPLLVENRCTGVLALFARQPITEGVLADLAPLADGIAQCIERKQIEAALRSSNASKDEFLALLAHELRNPLAPIGNALGIFRAKALADPELQWARDVIDRQVKQMTRLVDDLLDVSRIDRGKIELRKESVELAAVIDCAVEASRPLIDKAGHELILQLPPQPVYLDADPTRLAQVILNLLNNAAKYTEPGGRIWLAAATEDGQVAIRVRDTGVGIPPEMLPRVFDMFTQVERSIERSQGGLGIGLMLVRRLVEMHGGTVEARSAGADQGSEFIVSLPIASAVNRSSGEGDKAEPAPEFTQRRILVVDDNQDAAESLAILLRLRGNEVRTANDGLEAVETATASKPEVVLLDIGLPKLNGYDAARRIRAQLGREVVLIALTGWGQEDDLRRAKEAGFDHHLMKPVDFPLLQKLLALPDGQK